MCAGVCLAQVCKSKCVGLLACVKISPSDTNGKVQVECLDKDEAVQHASAIKQVCYRRTHADACMHTYMLETRTHAHTHTHTHTYRHTRTHKQVCALLQAKIEEQESIIRASKESASVCTQGTD